tara:strand:+ start:361 stop:1020 length:660 start_codon:yes stop_codon:yes gene_type:complete
MSANPDLKSIQPNIIDVLVCDDHQIFKDGIRSILSDVDWIQIWDEARNGVECLEQIKSQVPDVVLLDINMPVMDGIECLKVIKADFPSVKVIALTQFDEKRFVKQMLKYGADGYVLKSTSKKELLTAIQTVLKGNQYLAESVDPNTVTKQEDSPLFPDLSTREVDVLKLLANEKSTKQIAEELFISFHTVESHRANLFRKLQVKNLAGLVKWAVNNDYA